MTVLHGFVTRDGSLAIWGETDHSQPVRPAPGAGELPLTRGVGESVPLTAGAGELPLARGVGEPVPLTAGAGGLPSARSMEEPLPAVGESRARAARAGGRRSGAVGGGVHPFAFAPGGEPRPSTLLLPSTSAGPMPSPALGMPRRRGTPRLRPWVVPAVVVPFVTADLADEFGARAAPSLTYLAEVCVFAADLVARGRVLPAVLTDGPRPRAAWRPVLSGADGARHADLLARMPPACRAERARPGEVDGLPAADTLHAALHRLVDGLVRTRLAESGVTLGGAPWLTALTAGDEPAEPAEDPATRAGGSARLSENDRLGDSGGLGESDRLGLGGSGRLGDSGRLGISGGLGDTGGLGESDRLGDSGGLGGSGRLGEFDARPGALDTLTEALDTWHAEATSGTAVRVVFRLSHLHELEPDEPDATDQPDATGAPEPTGEPEDAWLLEFLLQPLDEPSLLVPAADVWRDAVAPLRRWTHRPQERLIAGLGRAARLFGDLEAALRVARPAEIVLGTEGAHRFLSHASLLEQAGYGVLLPAWWREPQRLGLALEVRTRDAAAPVLRDEAADLASIVGYNWGLSLGGRVLTEDELAVLARVKVPLVRLRGRWVHLDPERLRAGLEFLRRGGGTMTAGDALRMVRLLPPEEVPLPVSEVRGHGWVADLLSGRLGERLELREPPGDLAGVLRPYQIRGFSWLSFLDGLGLGACLADDMGLGKTVQLLALLLHRPRGPVLLICPLSVLGNWQREAARFAPSLRVKVLHGADRPDPATLVVGADVVLTTYATATRDADELAAVEWDRVVLDEAQHIKNSASGAAKAVRRFPARQRVALTGTPVENRLAELWSILDFLNPGLLGSAHTFRNRYAVPIERYADEDAAARLRTATRPFLLRRVKSDPAVITDLPDKRHVRHLCGLTAEQATLYRAVLDDMMLRLKETGETRRKGIVLAAMTKLKQACNHPAHLLGDGSPLPGRSGKLERLEEILDAALAGGESALCFTQFARFGAMLVPHLAARFGVPVRYLHGGTPRGARDDMVAAFQADTRPGIFVLSLKAGGTGLNLTAASHVVHVDRWWNPATEAQATDRAFRIGQSRDVRVHTLVTLGTLEERIDRLIADKGVLAERVVGNGEGWLTTLSTDDLRDLTRLDPEAIGD